MGTHLKRSIRAFAVLALLALPSVSLADVTPAPVVAPVTPTAPVQTPVQTPTQTHTQTQTQTQTPTKTGPTAAELAAQKKAAAAQAKARAEAARKARIAAAKAKAAARARAAAEAARKHAALVAAQKKAAAERARLVAQQQHAEDTAEATFQKALQRDDAFRFATTAATSIGASAAIVAAPLDPADAKAGSKAFATSPTDSPPIPLFAAIAAAVALMAAAGYAVRSRAWLVR
jgi:hypothetical protein